MPDFIYTNIVDPYAWTAEGVQDFLNEYGIFGALAQVANLDSSSSFMQMGIFFFALVMLVGGLATVLTLIFGINRQKWNQNGNRSGTWFAISMVAAGYICGKLIAPYAIPYDALAGQSDPMMNAFISAYSGIYCYVAAFLGLIIALIVNRFSYERGTSFICLLFVLAMPIVTATFASAGVAAASVGLIALIAVLMLPWATIWICWKIVDNMFSR